MRLYQLSNSTSACRISVRTRGARKLCASETNSRNQTCPQLRSYPQLKTVPADSVLLYNLWDSIVPYEAAWAFQKAEAAEYADSLDSERQIDRLVILQHPPTYTLGECCRFPCIALIVHVAQ